MAIALLSQEGSGIAKRIPRGVVPMGTILKVGALEPPRRFAPPKITRLLRPIGLAFAAAHDSGGEYSPLPVYFHAQRSLKSLLQKNGSLRWIHSEELGSSPLERSQP